MQSKAWRVLFRAMEGAGGLGLMGFRAEVFLGVRE